MPAGRMQDRLGPRRVATIGGILVGLGMLMAGLMGNSHIGYVVGFGVLAGAGIGFGYASATPPAVKWFPPAKTGLIAGIVVSGFGLASVYIVPLAEYLIVKIGLDNTVISLGIGFLVVVTVLAQFLRVPHKVKQLTQSLGPVGELKVAQATPVKKENFTPTEVLKTWQFYLMWFLYACGAGAGLMVISIAKTLGMSFQPAQVGGYAVMGLAIGNGAGRILAGMISDKIGRKHTLVIFFVLQAVVVCLLPLVAPGKPLGDAIVLIVVAALVGANYGANLSLFPSFTKDYYGLKNFGVNYGLVFTAWGVGGFMLAQLAGWVQDTYKTFTYSYYFSAALLVVAAAATFILKAPHHHEPAPAPADQAQAEKELAPAGKAS
ncbi:MAG: OFA family MFS transporter [Planctomycetota bacterium]|nr:OFA family MFS transporter [Planctomycetota bacterium]